MRYHRYEPRGFQAIHPQALFGLFMEAEEPETVERNDATIITIRGPLQQHAGWWGDSYEAIRDRIAAACALAAPVVVLRIDSPGGEVAGLFDAARAIRSDCDAAGKQLVVHVEGQCSSAAYALACVADRITASRTADVGSIGVIAARADITAMDAMEGVRVELITSGRRKADWNPHAPLTDEELAEHQAEVDGLATEFFELVALHRHMTTDTVAALEAASFRGEAAVKVGLVDELGSFDHVIASLTAAPRQEMSMDEIQEALRAIAEDEECSDEEREKARRALAALEGEEDEDIGDSDEAPADDDEPADEDTEGEEDEEDAEGEEDETEAKARSRRTVSASTAGELAARGSDLERRLEKLERREAAAERKRLIAAHGGVPAGMAKLLASKPLAEVKALLAELPKPRKTRLGDAAATATVAGTRGGGKGQESQLPPAEAKAMRRAMGLEKETFGVVQRGNILMLGAPVGDGGVL